LLDPSLPHTSQYQGINASNVLKVLSGVMIFQVAMVFQIDVFDQDILSN
jgi:hypothetical protein